MMKNYIAFIVAVVMLMLAACQSSKPGQQGQPETQPTTTVPTQMTTAPTETTTAPTETTVQTEVQTTEPEEVLQNWMTDPDAQPNYEEYWNSNLPYDGETPMEWVGMDGGIYTVLQNQSGLNVVNAADEIVYTFADTSDLQAYELIGVDGLNAYLYKDYDLVLVDLHTGNRSGLVMKEYLVLDAKLVDEDVLYYAAFDPDEWEIRVFFRCHGALCIAPYAVYGTRATSLFWLQTPEAPRENIAWTCVNSDMVEKLREELGNPDSSYRANFPEDIQEAWNKDLLVDFSQQEFVMDLCYTIQQDTGIPALMYVTYSLEDTAVVDTRIFDLEMQ